MVVSPHRSPRLPAGPHLPKSSHPAVVRRTEWSRPSRPAEPLPATRDDSFVLFESISIPTHRESTEVSITGGRQRIDDRRTPMLGKILFLVSNGV